MITVFIPTHRKNESFNVTIEMSKSDYDAIRPFLSPSYNRNYGFELNVGHGFRDIGYGRVQATHAVNSDYPGGKSGETKIQEKIDRLQALVNRYKAGMLVPAKTVVIA